MMLIGYLRVLNVITSNEKFMFYKQNRDIKSLQFQYIRGKWIT